MIKPVQNTVMHSYPGMVALVTVSVDGKENVMAAGWHSYISYDPPIYGVAIGRERYTHGLIKEAGVFGINFVPFERARFIQQTGVYSGEHTNKFDAGDMEFFSGSLSVPILKEAYVAYECKTIDVNSYGDHDWFVGEIVQCHRDEERFLENGLPDFQKLTIPLYVGRSTYTSVNKMSEFHTFHITEEE
ncbi:flavin reductase [Bacillus sp. RO3]|nr:flavin reductase [Bacillus sp. RO3]